MLSIILVASIAVAVVLGYKTKINTGFFCIAFAYLIGCFGMGIKTKELISFWPVSTMFVILSVSLFYNFAAVNGTLEKMSASLLYMCRRFPGMLPFALFFVAVVLSVMGAAYFTVLAFLAPITILICEEAKMDKLTGAVAINCGACRRKLSDSLSRRRIPRSDRYRLRVRTDFGNTEFVCGRNEDFWIRHHLLPDPDRDLPLRF